METARKRVTLLVAAVVLLQLVAVYVLVLSLQRQLTSEFAGNAQETLDNVADSVTDRSTRVLNPARDAVGVGVELLNEGVIDSDDDIALETYFKSQLAGTPWLSGMFLGRADGSFVYLARNEFGLRTKRISIDGARREVQIQQRDADGNPEEPWVDNEDAYDPRTRSWYLKAQGSDTFAWTDPYLFFSSGLPGISVAARAQDGTVIGADVEIRELSSFIEHIPHAREGTAVIVDGALNVIARSGTVGLISDTPVEGIPKLADVARAPMLALYDTYTRTAGPGTNALVAQDVDSHTYLGLAREFPVAQSASDWTLLVQFRADDYAGGALNYFNNRVVLLGLLSIGLGALAFGGIVWLHRAGRRAELDAPLDPVSGVLRQLHFERLLDTQRSVRRGGEDLGVLVIEALELGRLGDRLGSQCRDSVVGEIGRRLAAELGANDLLGISPARRFFVATGAVSRADLLVRLQQLHDAASGDGEFATHCGSQSLTIASGVAMLEPGEPVGNLLPRAREALAIGVERNMTRCAMSASLQAVQSSELVRAA